MEYLMARSEVLVNKVNQLGLTVNKSMNNMHKDIRNLESKVRGINETQRLLMEMKLSHLVER